MKSKRKVSILTLLFSYINQVFLIVQGIILVPIYLSYFPIAVYGAWLATGNIVGILGMLEGGMNMVFSQKLSYSFGQNKIKEFILITSSGLLITFLILLLLILLGFILSPFVPRWTNISSNYYPDIRIAFIIASLAAGFGILSQNLSAIVASWLDAQINGIGSLVSSSIGLVTIIIGLKFNLGVISIPLGSLSRGIIGSIFFGIYILLKKKRNNYPKFQFDFATTKQLVKATIPMTFSNIGSAIINQSQFLIIANFINPTTTAIYAITIRVFTAVASFVSPIASAIFNSVAYYDIKTDSTKVREIFNKTFSLHGLISIMLFGIVLAFNKAFIFLWVGPDKYGGDYLTILTFFAIFLSYRFSFISTFFMALGYIKRGAISSFVEITIRVVFIVVLIMYVGVLSFPIAQIISAIIGVCFYLDIISSSFMIKLKMSFLSLLNNFSYLILVFAGAITVLILSKSINNWALLVSYSTIFSLVMLLLSLAMSKTLRVEFSALYKNLNLTRLYAKKR